MEAKAEVETMLQVEVESINEERKAVRYYCHSCSKEMPGVAACPSCPACDSEFIEEREGGEKEKEDQPGQESQVYQPGDHEAQAENLQSDLSDLSRVENLQSGEGEGSSGEKRKREASPARSDSDQDSLELKLFESPEKRPRQIELNDTPELEEYEEMALADRKLCRNGFTLRYIDLLRQERDAEVIVID